MPPRKSKSEIVVALSPVATRRKEPMPNRKRPNGGNGGPDETHGGEQDTEMLNVRVSCEMMERFRRVLYWTAPRRSQAQVIRKCIRVFVEEHEAKNGGKPFKPRPSNEEQE